MVFDIGACTLYNDSMTTQTPTNKPKQKLYSWKQDTLDLLAECQRLGGYESETATIKAALAVYHRLLIKISEKTDKE